MSNAPTAKNPSQNWQIETRYQAIVDAQQQHIHGLEALSRGPVERWQNAEALFSDAYRNGHLLALERQCIALACQRFAGEANQKLFLNVHGVVLQEQDVQNSLMHWVAANPLLQPSQVVLELSERCPQHHTALEHAVDQLRSHGFTFAIDDFGVGDSGLLRWARLRPEYVKLDRQLIHGVAVHPDKMAFLKGIQHIAQSLGCDLIAEGVETKDDAQTLIDAGVRYLQGYFFHRPGRLPAHSDIRYVDAGPTNADTAGSDKLIGHLARDNPIIPANTRMDDVISQFLAQPKLNCLPVVQDGRVLGLITRHQALELYSQDFGRELYGRKPAHQLMSKQTTLVEAGASLESVSYQLTEKSGEDLPQEFVICRGGDYLGVVRTGDLLRRITDQQLRNARHANPLTLLPGNVPISDRIDALLREHTSFQVAYCDLNNFKAFNDVYGYAQGDIAIKLLAQCLRDQCNIDQDFIGHVGGDDFIVLFRSSQAEAQCRKICAQFAREVRRLYDADALEKNGIVTTDRDGQRRFYPLMSLAIGLCQPDSRSVRSSLEVSALASEAKSRAKRMPGGGVFVCRRGH